MTSLWHYFLVICLLSYCTADWIEDFQNGKTISVGDDVKIRVDKITDSVNETSYFSSHVIRVFLDDVGFTVAKAKGKEGLQIGLFTSDGSTEARGTDTNVFSVLLPLLIGFKIAGSILTTLVVVLIVSLKAFLAAKISLLLTAAGVLKKMTTHTAPAAVHYPMEYYAHPMLHHPPTAHDYPSASGYNAPVHSAPSSPGPSAHDHDIHNHLDDHELTATAADSNISALYVAANASDGNSASTQYQRGKGSKRRVYKHRSPIVPILTLSKITRKGD